MNTPEEYFKKWAANCRIFTNYKAIHSHEDMMRFAKDYHNEQLRLNGVSRSKPVEKEIVLNVSDQHTYLDTVNKMRLQDIDTYLDLTQDTEDKTLS